MFQIQILSGKSAGVFWTARRFPLRIGRAPGNDLQLEEPGVWDQHLQLEMSPADGIILTSNGDALVTVNNERVQRARLKNGDSIEAGSARLRFWLGGPERRKMLWLEISVWLTMLAVLAAQTMILIALLR